MNHLCLTVYYNIYNNVMMIANNSNNRTIVYYGIRNLLLDSNVKKLIYELFNNHSELIDILWYFNKDSRVKESDFDICRSSRGRIAVSN